MTQGNVCKRSPSTERAMMGVKLKGQRFLDQGRNLVSHCEGGA
jgi:hypothetical protein